MRGLILRIGLGVPRRARNDCNRLDNYFGCLGHPFLFGGVFYG